MNVNISSILTFASVATIAVVSAREITNDSDVTIYAIPEDPVPGTTNDYSNYKPIAPNGGSEEGDFDGFMVQEQYENNNGHNWFKISNWGGDATYEGGTDVNSTWMNHMTGGGWTGGGLTAVNYIANDRGWGQEN